MTVWCWALGAGTSVAANCSTAGKEIARATLNGSTYLIGAAITYPYTRIETVIMIIRSMRVAHLCIEISVIAPLYYRN